jgi:transposase
MPMDGLPSQLPDDLTALKRLLQQQQRTIEQQRKDLDRKQQLVDRSQEKLNASEQRVERFREKVIRKQDHIERLEERLRRLLVHRFGRRSEKNADQFQLFNEAELLAEHADEAIGDEINVPAHTRKRNKATHTLPADLPRVEVEYELAASERHCACGQALARIGEEVLEQLAVIPQQYYVIRHVRPTFACSCKGSIRTASMPAQPLPACQVSPPLLAHVMVSKYLDGLPLYRQEKIAAREGLDLPRAKLARWLIDGSRVFQPLVNLLTDTFFAYDIAMSDDTGIRVLKEDGRAAISQSALWIRRGGPPDKPVVLVDYATSKSGETAYGLLSEFRGTLVCDGASNFNEVVARNELSVALCNDHARRRFHKVCAGLGKEQAAGSIAEQGLHWYRRLYAIERDIKDLSVEDKYERRQAQAVPHWEAFIAWARQVHSEGVAHAGTREGLSYLLNHAKALQRYCDDGRLPISNIQSEHVAKTIAIARKNFLFADTAAGAESSGRIFSLIETARANGHHPQRYLSVLLTELPNVTDVDQVEALLPWNLTPATVAERYASYPAP